MKMILKNGCKCQEQTNKTIYKSSRLPSIKEGIGYNRSDGKANGRNIINGVPCVEFNRALLLMSLYARPTTRSTFQRSNLQVTRQSRRSNPMSPSHKHHFHGAKLVTICVVGARMARLWLNMLVPKRERKL